MAFIGHPFGDSTRVLLQTSYENPLGPNIADSVAWERLSSHVPEIEQTHLRELLKDETRTDMLTAESDGVYADFSRQRVTGDTLKVCPRTIRQKFYIID